MQKHRTLCRPSITDSVERRFWDKLTRAGEDECWLWQGSRIGARAYGPFQHEGYGRLYLGRFEEKQIVEYAHRISYVLHLGEDIPAGMVVMHTCDNPPCCNPAHLRLDTYSANSLDREKKRRRPRSEGRFILSDTLDEVTELYLLGMTADEISRHFGVGLSTARKAIKLSGVSTRGSGPRTKGTKTRLQLWRKLNVTA